MPTRHKPNTLHELLPDRLRPTRSGILLHCFIDDLLEVLLGPVPTRKPNEGEGRGQKTAVCKVVDSGEKLFPR